MKNKNIIIGSLVALVILLGLFYLGQSQANSTGNQLKVLDNQAAASGGAGSGIETDGKGSVADLVVSEKLYDFGTIRMADGEVEKSFTVTNSTGKDILIDSIVTSCMCTVAYLEGGSAEKGPFGMPGHGGPSGRVNEIVKAGESRTIRVVFDPNAHGPAGVGPIDRQIILSDRDGGSLELGIKGMVRP